MARVDLSLRIRQAILLNDLALIQRLLRNNPACLHNPDYADKSNTSLHLAAQYGLEEIAVGTQLTFPHVQLAKLHAGIPDFDGP